MITETELKNLELKFSGGFEKVIPPKASPLDTRPAEKSVFHGHRMQPKTSYRGRNYAPMYSEWLSQFDRNSKITIVELGILRGVGLAMWCDLFPNARVIGLDVDTSLFIENLPNLQKRGAFQKNRPEFHYYDELHPDAIHNLEAILNGDQINIMIDDALHYNAAIVKAFGDFKGFMAADGVYFIEDNFTVSSEIEHPLVYSVDEMTVVVGF